jgi:predicted lipoprotein with Yx(FWY)xxD motif
VKRVLILAVLASCAALTSSLPTASAATRASGTQIDLHGSRLGKILVTSKGFTIYVFTADTKNHDNCQTKPHCMGTWAAVLTTGMPTAGAGVHQSLLGTTMLGSGKLQVTYNGHPLYTYIGDTQKHETSYVNFPEFGGKWRAINAAGKEVT